MTFAVKIPIEVKEEEEPVLESQSEIQNWAYNHLLEKANAIKEEYIKTQDPELAQIIYTETGLRDLLPNLKKEKPFLQGVHSVPLKKRSFALK